MKNIHRKVHQPPTKNQHASHQNIPDSFDSFQNSTTQHKKRLIEEIEKMEQKMNELQHSNSMICEENLELESKISLVKNMSQVSTKSLYNILMESYQIQYIKFAQKIQNQLIEQSTLLNGLYQKQKQPSSNSSYLIDTSQRQLMNEKSKFDSGNYNSTSSGGSLNGHRYRQDQLSRHFSHQKLNHNSDWKFQPLITEQNNIPKLFDSKKINTSNQFLIPTPYHKQSFRNQLNSNEFNKNDRLAHQYLQEKIEPMVPEQKINECLNRCVIDLKNRRNQQQNDLSRMHKTIVLNQNQFNHKLTNISDPLNSG